MAEPTLIEIFGTSAIQTETTITIAKADLVGLTASNDNSAESLLAAILVKAKPILSRASFDANLDQSLYIETGFSSFTNRGEGVQYRLDQLTVNLAKIDNSATIDPDEY